MTGMLHGNTEQSLVIVFITTVYLAATVCLAVMSPSIIAADILDLE